MKKNIAYHFVGEKLRDGRPVPPDGKWLIHKGNIKMCDSGLHASLTPFDALQYAPGSILCRVRYGGRVILGDDKLVCTRRLIEARFAATELMRSFARKRALSVIHLWEAPDVVKKYMETGDESLRSAVWSAAWSAARAAAWSAACDAASDAARAAAATEFNNLVYAEFKRQEDV